MWSHCFIMLYQDSVFQIKKCRSAEMSREEIWKNAAYPTAYIFNLPNHTNKQ